MTTRTMPEIQVDLQQVLIKIDNLDGETPDIPPDLIDECLSLKEERDQKVDNWIWYRDRLKHLVAEMKERKDRFTKAYRVACNFKKAFDKRLRFHIEQDKTGVPFKGKDMGTVYLHTSPASLTTLTPQVSKTVTHIIEDEFYQEICKEYLKTVQFIVLDTQKIKQDLLDGKELTWATLEREKHVRIKG